METSTFHLIISYLFGVLTPFIVWYVYEWLNPEVEDEVNGHAE